MPITKDKMEKIERFVAGKLDSLDWQHTKEVREIALKLARLERADKEIVEIAALLHDVGKSKGEAGHIARSEQEARKYLVKAGFEQRLIEEVVYCIAVHDYPWTGQAQSMVTIESKILADSDIMQKLSVWGIVSKIIEYQDGFSKNYPEALKTLRDKLLNRRHLLITKSAQKMAEPGYKFIKEFFKKLV